MKLVRIFALAAGLAVACVHQGAAAQTLTPEDIWRPAAIQSPAASRDGKFLAALAPVGDKMNLVVLDLGTMKAQAVTSFKDFDVISFNWIGSARLVFTLGNNNSPTGAGQFDGGGLFAVDRDGKNGRELSPTIKQTRAQNAYVYRGFTYVRGVPDSSDEIIARSIQRDQEANDLYRLNTRTGRATLMSVDRPPRVGSWVLDSKLVPRVAVSSIKDTLISIVHYRKDASSPWTEIARIDEIKPEMFVPLAFDSNDQTLQVSTNQFGPTMEIWRFDPNTKKFVEKLAGHPLYDMGADAQGSTEGVPGLITDPATDAILGYAVEAAKFERTWLDATGDRIQKTLDAALPDTINTFRRLSKDSAVRLVTSFSDVKPTRWYLFDDDKKTLMEVFSSRPWLDGKLTQMRPFRYTTRDGLEIDGYYFLPKNYKAGTKLPTVVHIHGGPFARADRWGRFGFGEREGQLLAAQGYAVIVPNFRITPGLGNKVYYAGFGTVGRQMSEDHEDALKWGIAQGFVEPSKVCMSGASYGGYATLQALIKTPDMFKCGVAGLVVSDYKLQLTSPSGDTAGNVAGVNFWKQVLGVKDLDEPVVAAISPAQNPSKLRNPVLFYAGLDDTRTPIEQTTAMVRGLERTGNPPKEVFVAKDEGHGFGRMENRLENSRRILKFLDEQIGSKSK
jgi:dipeptidyl aminopeptidase/acylaminoacyl peptidase